MFHEEAADQVVAVAEPGRLHVARVQQKARVLDPAGSEDEDAGDHLERFAVQGGHGHAVDHRVDWVPVDQGDVGVKDDLDVCGAIQLVAIVRSEALGVVSGNHRFDPCGVERKQGQVEQSRDVVGLVAKRTEVDDVVGSPVVGVQLLVSERPAAIGNRRGGLEVHRSHRRAMAAPVIGRATEISQPRGGKDGIRPAHIQRAGQRMGRLVELLAATFEQNYPRFVACQRLSDGDPCGAGADDADLGFEALALGDLASVDEHGPLFSAAPLLLRSPPLQINCGTSLMLQN